MACCKSFIGVFCTNIGAAVFGFVDFKNGLPSFSYYDAVTGDKVDDPIITECPGAVVNPEPHGVQMLPYNIGDANVGETVFSNSLFNDISTDSVSGLHKVMVFRDTKLQYENQPINSYIVDTGLGEITLDSPLNSGEKLIIIIL